MHRCRPAGVPVVNVAAILTGVTYRGVLLDFYGTVVDEDGPVIRRIVRQIVGEHPEHSAASLARTWGRLFTDLLAASHGDTFRTQRELEIESLATLLRTVGSTLDPGEFVGRPVRVLEVACRAARSSRVPCGLPGSNMRGLQHRSG